LGGEGGGNWWSGSTVWSAHYGYPPTKTAHSAEHRNPAPAGQYRPFMPFDIDAPRHKEGGGGEKVRGFQGLSRLKAIGGLEVRQEPLSCHQPRPREELQSRQHPPPQANNSSHSISSAPTHTLATQHKRANTSGDETETSGSPLELRAESPERFETCYSFEKNEDANAHQQASISAQEQIRDADGRSQFGF